MCCRELLIYQLWTLETVQLIAAVLQAHKARRAVEVCAGDGRLSKWLQVVALELDITATDSMAWWQKRTLLPHVRKADLQEALRQYKPDWFLSS